MCKGSSKANTTTTSSSPNPTAMAAYNDILARANSTASTPYQSYTGELVAPINAQQQLGIANINAAANSAAPSITGALGYANAAAQPLTEDEIRRYMSPYTQDVVDATQAQFNNQNAQQIQGVKGNSILRGSMGGNREAIAEAETRNQQQLAQAPVIAGLRNQGYATGLNTALTEQQAKAQAAYSLGNLGVAGQNAALTGANAQIGAGTLEQQIKQAQDAAAYQQYVNQLAYPFQTTQWLAGIGTGVGSQMGGTGATTAPPPNQTGQIMGGLGAGVGMLGATGAFGSAGWLLPAMAAMATGGAVRRASGGVAPEAPTTLPEGPETLRLQQRQLMSGHRRVQMFPHGTPELPMPRGMMRTTTDSGTFHYDPRRVHENDIHRLSADGRENDLLDLGPYSKDDILKRLHGGEVPVTVVERHPDGTEARAAIGTHTTADRQMAAMNRTKSPGHIVRTEDPRETIAHRLRALGGRVPGFAGGGSPMGEAPPTNGVGAVMAGTPYGGGTGFIPRMEVTRGRGAPVAPGVAPVDQSLANQAKQIGSLANLINKPESAGSTNTDQNEGAGLSASDENPSPYRRGGVVADYASGGLAAAGIANLPFHMVPHLAEGGSPYDTDYFDNTFSTPIRHTQDAYDIVSNPDRYAAFGDRARETVLAENPNYVPMPRSRPEGIAPSYGLPPEITAGTSRPSVEGDRVAMNYAGDGTVPAGRSRPVRPSVPVVEGDQPSPLDDAAWPHGPRGAPGGGYDSMAQDERTGPPLSIAPPRGVAPPSGIDLSGNSKLWPSLMAAGFGAMASQSPFLGNAIGEGGLAGMHTYANERQREDRISHEVKKLAQEAEFAQKRLDLATRPYTEQTADQKAKSKEAERYHDILGNRMQLRPTGTMVETPEGPHPVFIDSRSGMSIDGITGEPVEPNAKIITAPGKAGAVQTLAKELMRDREEERKKDPNLPALTFEEAVALAHRSPDADRGTARRLAMANGAWGKYTSNPVNMGKKDDPKNTIEYWEKHYGVTGAPTTAPGTAPAPKPASAVPAPAASATAPAPPRPVGVPPDAKPQRNKTTGAYRWVMADGTIYSADGVKQ